MSKHQYSDILFEIYERIGVIKVPFQKTQLCGSY